MEKKTTYNVFFARRQNVVADSDVIGRLWEIYLSGKESGIEIDDHDVMHILSHAQYSDFKKDVLIFEIKKAILDPYLKKKPPIDQRKRWPAL